MLQYTRILAAPILFLLPAVLPAQQPVQIHVHLKQANGTLKPVWANVGHDEPNYTYSPEGRGLLQQLARLCACKFHDRTHNLLTTGNGTPALKWGSTNAYTVDAAGRPIYDWKILDRIFDTYKAAKIIPYVEIGFMPRALSAHPEPYHSRWPHGPLFTGWSYPPRNYRRWSELIYRWVRHEVHRYGKKYVEGWDWEVWNEPDIGYWHGSERQYEKLYDYTAAAVKRALPQAHVGGPATTGPAAPHAAKFLRDFLTHCVKGKNYATGKTGSPLDFISFHAKGRTWITLRDKHRIAALEHRLLTKPSVLSCLGDPQAHRCTLRSPRDFRLTLLAAFHEAIPSELLFPERPASFNGGGPGPNQQPGLPARCGFNTFNGGLVGRRCRTVRGEARMDIRQNLEDIAHGFAIVAGFPSLRRLPIMISESDPDPCAACSASLYPRNSYRNTPQYASYEAELLSDTLTLAARYHVHLQGYVSWAFIFPGHPYFYGYRSLATHGIAKPVLNAFRMFGMLQRRRVRATSSGQWSPRQLPGKRAWKRPDIGVLATRGGDVASILVWNYDDRSVSTPPAKIEITVDGLPAKVSRVLSMQFSIDREHSDAYTAWKAMGSPQSPTPEQIAALKAAGQLQLMSSPEWLGAHGGKVKLSLSLPQPGLSLFRLHW